MLRTWGAHRMGPTSAGDLGRGVFARRVKPVPGRFAIVCSVKPDTLTFYERAVHAAVRRVCADLDAALDLSELARSACLSPFHFHRVFKGMVGETPRELARRLRLERAAHGLAHGEAPVTTLAFEAGYESHEAFTRAFRAAYGLPPSQLREHARDAARCTPPGLALASRSAIHFAGLPLDPDFRLIGRGEHAMQVQIHTLDPLRLVTARHVGPYPRIGEAFARLGPIAGRAGLVGPASQMIALYHDDPETVPVEALRSDAAFSIPAAAPIPDGLGEGRIPGGRYACALYVGPYTGLGDAWAWLMGAWLPGSGERVAEGVSFERYLNDPSSTAPDALRTELCIPLV